MEPGSLGIVAPLTWARMAKKRKRRGPRADAAPPVEPEARNEAARAALEAARPGERPTAVTIGAIVAGLLAVANIVALVLG